MTCLSEWWIQDRHTVISADGDNGPVNHEGVVAMHTMTLLLDELAESNDEFLKLLRGCLREDYDGDIHYLRMEILDASDCLSRHAGAPEDFVDDPYSYMIDKGITEWVVKGATDIDLDHRLLGMQRLGWSAVREDRVDTYSLNSRKMKTIASGLEEIADQEGTYLEDVEWGIQDFKTMQMYRATMRDLRTGDAAALFHKSTKIF